MSDIQNKIRVYSYAKVWKLEKKIYAIQNIQLPVPVSPNQVLYFLGTLGSVFIITSIIPFLSGIPALLKFGAIPFLLSKFLLTKKLDGKNPIKYFMGLSIYLFEKTSFIERYQERRVEEKPIKLNWNCSQGRYKKIPSRKGKKEC